MRLALNITISGSAVDRANYRPGFAGVLPTITGNVELANTTAGRITRFQGANLVVGLWWLASDVEDAFGADNCKFSVRGVRYCSGPTIGFRLPSDRSSGRIELQPDQSVLMQYSRTDQPATNSGITAVIFSEEKSELVAEIVRTTRPGIVTFKAPLAGLNQDGCGYAGILAGTGEPLVEEGGACT